MRVAAKKEVPNGLVCIQQNGWICAIRKRLCSASVHFQACLHSIVSMPKHSFGWRHSHSIHQTMWRSVLCKFNMAHHNYLFHYLSKQKPNVVSYQMHKDWAGLISLIENVDPCKWLLVTMRASLKPSKLATSSRVSRDRPGTQSSQSFYSTPTTIESFDSHINSPQSFTLFKQTDKAEKFKNRLNADETLLARLATTRKSLVTRDLIPPCHG